MNKLLIKILIVTCFCITSLKSYSQEHKLQFSAPANKSTFLLPIPNKKIAVNARINITNKGEKIESNFSIINTWVNNNEYIRLLLIELKYSNKNKKNSTQNFVIDWVNTTHNPRLKTQSIVGSPYLVYPLNSWLTESILLQPELNDIDKSWYTKPQSLYANFITNESLLEAHNYPKSHQSQWLFDRGRAVIQLFILTEDAQWLVEGKKISQFYINNLDDEGRFLLNENFDLKFLMPNGILYYYFLTGDSRIKDVLKKLFYLSLIWSPDYKSNYKFWTERHQAAALNIAISYWEISGDIEAKRRIDEIINATIKMVFYPKDGWELRGCPQHTFKSHEGKAGNSPVCSPWMMALLADALWRYYILTDNKQSAALLNTFGDFILNNGIHFANKRQNNKVLPIYLASMGNKLLEIKNQWTDGHHSCDVAGLIGKSLYIKEQKSEDTFLLKELFNAFVQQCKDINIEYKNKKHDYIPMLPPRRFGWTYSTTSDLPWLESWLNSRNTQ